jgi:hypothetical protein
MGIKCFRYKQEASQLNYSKKKKKKPVSQCSGRETWGRIAEPDSNPQMSRESVESWMDRREMLLSAVL